MNDLRAITTALMAGKIAITKSPLSPEEVDRIRPAIAGYVMAAQAIIDATPDPKQFCLCSKKGCYLEGLKE